MMIRPKTRTAKCDASSTFGIFRLPNLFHKSSAVYRPTIAVQNNPTHLILHTQPMLIPVRKSQKNHSGEKLSFCSLWNLAQQKTVVKVKQRSIESSRMNRDIVAYEFSHRTIKVTSQTVGRLKFSSRAVKYAKGMQTAPNRALKIRMKV